ncbi:MAG: sigma-54-dependent Fis family transcriptional regulator [Deltaproteobacteria bacterium]|nr:sigma-54-dependent Fis family transcriptional regulator [Deltaproteobacteria bacterium]
MRAEDLNHRELLELDPKGGMIRFAGQRALLLDAVAMGILRKYLVENFGLTAAHAVLSQFGFAHGWRMADALEHEFSWASNKDWRLAGPRIHSLGGLFSIQSGTEDVLAAAGSVLTSSFEAEQHLLHFGRAETAVCWTICGLLSGYLSRTAGQEMYVFEDRCLGKGDSACHIRARTRDAWGQERAGEMTFFDQGRLSECLDISLRRVTDTLKEVEETLRKRRRALREIAPDIEEPIGIIAKSKEMLRVIDVARRVAGVDSTVIITGESGSGKERIARLIHDGSPRAAGPFIAVNCGAVTETLLESELFGHARGAFTGATSPRAGLFEAAQGGTLLLDEVGEISPAMQVKLLRALQEREVRRVGENESRPIDVRLIAATNRDPAEAVKTGLFRQDFYYRLKVVEIRVPALRERRADILPLARALLSEAADRMNRTPIDLAPSAADQILRYSWPGNVRELANAMERAVALAQGGRVGFDDLPEEVRLPPEKPSMVIEEGGVRKLAGIEKDYILAALELNAGNQTRTAEQLGIGSATMYRKLKSYGLVETKRPQS